MQPSTSLEFGKFGTIDGICEVTKRVSKSMGFKLPLQELGQYSTTIIIDKETNRAAITLWPYYKSVRMVIRKYLRQNFIDDH